MISSFLKFVIIHYHTKKLTTKIKFAPSIKLIYNYTPDYIYICFILNIYFILSSPTNSAF